MCRHFTDGGKLVRGLLSQGVGLKIEKCGKCGQEHHARDQHDHQHDFSANGKIAQAWHEIVGMVKATFAPSGGNLATAARTIATTPGIGSVLLEHVLLARGATIR